jgi:ParB/RepB/Spo0J family partition protein
MHAPIVRAVNSHYEIVSGHHRVAAAKRAGLAHVPCWVADLTDEESFMQLVLANAQSELSPLEIGIHALEAVEKGNKWARGGLKEYAKEIGKTAAYISQVRNAAEVLKAIKLSQLNLTDLLDKAQRC